MKQHFIDLLNQLESKEYVLKDVLQQFSDRINSDEIYTRDEGALTHFCSFFVPFDPESKRVFMGHHIKAGGWIPPGGHIDKGENPMQAVQREFSEELKHDLANEKIVFFDISYRDINGPRPECRGHYDFWHIVYIDEKDFDYDKKEFYEASWMSFEEALKVMSHPEYLAVVKNLYKRI